MLRESDYILLGKTTQALTIYRYILFRGNYVTNTRKKHLFREIAENMGLMQVVFMNATRLLRDPKSRLKQADPRLWLELHFVAA